MKTQRLKNSTRLNLTLVAISICGMLAESFGGVDPGFARPFFSIALLVSCAWTASLAVRAQPNGWSTCLVVLGLGLLAEIVGVTTGFPFGHYLYTDVWQPTVGLWTGQPFPVLVPLAWLTVVCFCAALVPATWNRWRSALAIGALAALVDIPMEFVMTQLLGYWEFPGTHGMPWSPWQNTAGWLGVGTLAGWFLAGSGMKTEFRVDSLVVGSGFFVFLAGVCVAHSSYGVAFGLFLVLALLWARSAVKSIALDRIRPVSEVTWQSR